MADVFVRTLTVLLVAFVTLNVKEWMETREFDVLACAIDAACIAAGTLPSPSFGRRPRIDVDVLRILHLS